MNITWRQSLYTKKRLQTEVQLIALVTHSASKAQIGKHFYCHFYVQIPVCVLTAYLPFDFSWTLVVTFPFPSKHLFSKDSLFCSPLRLAPDPFLLCLSQNPAAFVTHCCILIKTDSTGPAQSFKIFLIKDMEAQASLSWWLSFCNHN